MEKTNAVDRRRTSRHDVDLLVEQCTGALGRTLRATNLSLDGVRLGSGLPVREGSLVQMVVHVPGEQGPLRIRGTVAFTSNGVGVEFQRLTTRDRLQIAEFLFG
jgi:hypothetical protein